MVMILLLFNHSKPVNTKYVYEISSVFNVGLCVSPSLSVGLEFSPA